jgi:uncharacterized membrane protein
VTVPSQRIVSVDLLRGMVIAIMAIDHTREFVVRAINVYGDPRPWQGRARGR